MYEFPTPKGAVYLHHILDDPQMGPLIRVLPGFFSERPPTFEVLDGERFLTFFPVAAAAAKRIIEFVGNVPVPEALRRMPMFRAPGKIDTVNRRVVDWWLWDGNTSWRVDTLNEEQRDYPIKAIWNDTLLLERVLAEWRPRDYV